MLITKNCGIPDLGRKDWHGDRNDELQFGIVDEEERYGRYAAALRPAKRWSGQQARIVNVVEGKFCQIFQTFTSKSTRFNELKIFLKILKYEDPEPTSEEDEDDHDINELNKKIERQESTVSSSIPNSGKKN